MKRGWKLFFVGILMWIPVQVLAFVSASVDNATPVFGDSVMLTLEGRGQDVEFPVIADIGGFRIESSGTSQNIQAINGKVTKTVSKIYRFAPTNNVRIPAFEIKVDGAIEKTKPIQITLTQPTQTQDPDFILELRAEKETAYVGEQINMTLLFKRHRRAELMDLQYAQSPFEHFWVKQNGQENTYKDGDYVIHEIRYVGFPQKSGVIEISPAKMRVAIPQQSRDIFGFWVKQPDWKNVYSNKLSFSISQAPQKARLVGDFDISLSTDKSEVEANKPVNIVVEIKGKGNMDDIQEVELDIPGATVYADKSEKKYGIKDGIYGGVYKRTFAVVSGSDYRIPEVNLKYFNIQSNRVKIASTTPVFIKVRGSAASPAESQQKVILEKKEDTPEAVASASALAPMDMQSKLLYYMLGLFSGLFIFFLITQLKKQRNVKQQEAEMPVLQKVKKARSDKELLGVLIPLNNADPALDQTIEKLEQNLYNNQQNSINKKEIIKTIKSMQEEAA